MSKIYDAGMVLYEKYLESHIEDFNVAKFYEFAGNDINRNIDFDSEYTFENNINADGTINVKVS